MDIFLVNTDNPHADTLMRKLAEKSKPGAIIPLNDGEMELYCSPDFQQVSYGNDQQSKITKMEPGGSYVFVADQNTVIDDILQLEERLSIKVGIIRTRD